VGIAATIPAGRQPFKVPEYSRQTMNTSLLYKLLAQWPSFLAYTLSFWIILIMWINHHNLFSNIKKTDVRFMLCNGLLLFLITFIPFPTALLSEYIQSSEANTAAAVYSGTFFITSIAFNLLLRYASYNHRLLYDHITNIEIKEINIQYFFGPTFYGLALILAFINVTASVATNILLAVYYSVTATLSHKKN
jgi:uncharacterized membrane protein